MIKLVADKANGRIIGVDYPSDHMETLTCTGVMMVAGEMTPSQVAHATFSHPRQIEPFGELARRLRPLSLARLLCQSALAQPEIDPLSIWDYIYLHKPKL